MRSNLLGMCSVVASVAVAGSAMASPVPATLDPFTTGLGDFYNYTYGVPGNNTNFTNGVMYMNQAADANYSGGYAITWQNGVSGNPFVQRWAAAWGGNVMTWALTTSGSVTSSIDTNSRTWNSQVTGNFSSYMNYSNDDYGAASINLATWDGFAFDYAVSGNIVVSAYVAWGDYNWTTFQGPNNTISQAFATASSGNMRFKWSDFGAVDSSKIRGISIFLTSLDGLESSSFNASISNLVPGPGAAALVGLAGLMTRRRKA